MRPLWALLLALAPPLARADCVTTTGTNAALVYLDGEEPSAARVRGVEPESTVCDPATAAAVRDELAELREANQVLAAELLHAHEVATADGVQCLADLAAKDARIATLEAPREEPSPCPWAGAGVAVGLIMALLLGLAW